MLLLLLNYQKHSKLRRGHVPIHEQADGVLTRPMPQKSLEFLYQECPHDVAQLHDYWVPE